MESEIEIPNKPDIKDLNKINRVAKALAGKFNLSLGQDTKATFEIIDGDVMFFCPMCDFKHNYVSKVKEHCYRKHFHKNYRAAPKKKECSCAYCGEEFEYMHLRNMHHGRCDKNPKAVEYKKNNSERMKQVSKEKDIMKAAVSFATKKSKQLNWMFAKTLKIEGQSVIFHED